VRRGRECSRRQKSRLAGGQLADQNCLIVVMTVGEAMVGLGGVKLTTGAGLAG
jgi:hypothetical protein